MGMAVRGWAGTCELIQGMERSQRLLGNTELSPWVSVVSQSRRMAQAPPLSTQMRSCQECLMDWVVVAPGTGQQESQKLHRRGINLSLGRNHARQMQRRP